MERVGDGLPAALKVTVGCDPDRVETLLEDQAFAFSGVQCLLCPAGALIAPEGVGRELTTILKEGSAGLRNTKKCWSGDQGPSEPVAPRPPAPDQKPHQD